MKNCIVVWHPAYLKGDVIHYRIYAGKGLMNHDQARKKARELSKRFPDRAFYPVILDEHHERKIK